MTMTKTYTKEQIQALAEFLVKYQLESDGSIKALPTAMLEAEERLQYEDFIVRPQNSVDGKEHIFTFNK